MSARRTQERQVVIPQHQDTACPDVKQGTAAATVQ